MKNTLTLLKKLSGSPFLLLVFLFNMPAMADEPALQFEEKSICPGSDVTVEVTVENFTNIGYIRLGIPVDPDKVSTNFELSNVHPEISNLNTSFNANLSAFIITWYAQNVGQIANIGDDKIFDLELEYIDGHQPLDLDEESHVMYWLSFDEEPINVTPGGISPSIEIDQQPQDAETEEGEPATFDVGVAPVGPATYQWQTETLRGWTNLEDGDDFTGTDTASLTVVNTSQDLQGTFYRVVVERDGCVVTSEEAQLIITDQPQLYRLYLHSDPDEGGDTDGAGLYEAGEVFDITATTNDGFDFVEWTEEDTSISDEAVYSYTMPDRNVTLTANFEPSTYIISASSGDNGTINPSGDVEVNHGDDQTFTIQPDEGYEISELVVDGGNVAVTNSYTFDNIIQNHSIEASFELKSYTIYAVPNNADFGMVSGGGEYDHFQEATLNAIPQEGYFFVNWTENNEVISSEEELVFTVTEERDLVANFAANVVEINAVPNDEDFGSVQGAGSYEIGSEVSLTATPETGYHFTNWTEDDIEVSDELNYVFTAEEDRDLVANFSINTYTLTYSAEDHGTLTGDTEQTVNHGHDGTPVEAVPDPGYQFVKWSDGSTENPRTDENVVGNIDVTAEFDVSTYTISASANDGGTIDPEGDITITHGEDITFTITPDTDNGYEIEDVLVDGVSQGAITSHTFSNVTENHTIEAVFALREYTINATSDAGGDIDPDGNISVAHGGDITFTITPDADNGYEIEDVLVDDVSQGAITSYTFENVTENHTIEALFALREYTIAASSNEGGNVDPEGNITVTHGDDISFSINPDEEDGYETKEVLVDGVDQGAILSHTFENVQENHTIEAVFGLKIYTITASDGEGGYIDPVGTVTATHGDDVTFQIVPDEADGYEIHDVLVDDVSQGSIPTYTFDNIASNHTIEAQFELKTYTITATAGENGTIDPSGAISVEHGSDQTFTITPDNGYHIDELIVDGDAIEPQDEFTFENIAADHTIHVEFAANVYVITATASEGGTISPEGDVDVTHGANRTFTFTPDTGYHINDVLIDDTSIGVTGSYTFTNVTKDYTIHVDFAINTYTLLYSAGDNGSLTGDTDQSVDHGSDGTPVEAVPDDGYHFTEWSDGVTDNPRTDTEVTDDLDVIAYFAINTYTISASAGEGGSITPAGDVEVTHGDDQTFAITPDEGYEIDDVLVDGTSVGDVDSYTFENITQAHTIEATFEEKTYTITASAGDNGSISPDGDTEVTHGDDQTYTISPANGYHVSELMVDGDAVDPATSYTFEDVTQNHTIHAEFAINTYIIEATSTEGGSLDPEGDIEVTHGHNQPFSIDPDEGHYVVDVLIDDDPIGPTGSYTFINVTNHNSIHAIFDIHTYTLIYSAGENGTLTGDTEQDVDHGDDGTPVQAVPDDGYHFTEWSDGVTDNPRIDTDVTDDLDVTAHFEQTTYDLEFIVVDNEGLSIPDAVITLNDQTYEEGVYVFPDLPVDTYIYTVSHEAYEDAEGQAELIDGDVTETVEMQDDDTAIGEVDEVMTDVYPNPAREQITVETGEPLSEVRMIDMLGQVIYRARPEGATLHKIPVSGVDPGVYFVQVYAGSGVSTVRVQVIR